MPCSVVLKKDRFQAEANGHHETQMKQFHSFLFYQRLNWKFLLLEHTNSNRPNLIPKSICQKMVIIKLTFTIRFQVFLGLVYSPGISMPNDTFAGLNTLMVMQMAK